MRAFVTGGSGFLGRELIRALVAAGHEVHALARSEKSDAAVKAAGASPVRGDLEDTGAMAAGMEGCDVVFHSAAHTEEWDRDETFYRVNVTGTDNVLNAAHAAKVRRFVHISSEAALANGEPLVRADETKPLPDDAVAGYPFTKNLAERHALAAAGIEVVVVRPRLIWGKGDTSLLPKLVGAVKGGRFKWISGGHYLTSTCHVANACEGALLAAEKGKPGEVYFLTDGDPVELRWFFSEMFKTQQVEPPTGSIPRGLASTVAALTEPVWRAFGIKSPPPAPKAALALMGHEMTVVDAKARRELGYQGRKTIAEGLKELCT
jgi:nucleoside-diphosphate-sugar epimerase